GQWIGWHSLARDRSLQKNGPRAEKDGRWNSTASGVARFPKGADRPLSLLGLPALPVPPRPDHIEALSSGTTRRAANPTEPGPPGAPALVRSSQRRSSPCSWADHEPRQTGTRAQRRRSSRQRI